MKFIIKGNQENPLGNPIGYTRTTQGSKWSPNYARYCAWKEYVVAAFDRAANTATWEGKPIKSKEKMYLHTFMFFANKKHPDPDNVAKGVADALFQNDKLVAGSYDFSFDKDNPRVEVIIHRHGKNSYDTL